MFPTRNNKLVIFIILISFAFLLLATLTSPLGRKYFSVQQKFSYNTANNVPTELKSKNYESIIITIDTRDLHAKTRLLIGSVHQHEKERECVVYGINLTSSQKSEIFTWKNVQYIDVFDTFLMSSREGENVNTSIEF